MPDAAPDPSALKITDNGAVLVSRLNASIMSNAVMLGAFMCILVLTSLVLWILIRLCWRVYGRWKLQSAVMTPITPAKTPDGDDNVHAADDFDSLGGGGDSEELPADPQVELLRRRMAKVEAKYGAYNRAMGAHALEQGREPDDAIDKGILSHDNDEYVYRPRSRVPRGPDGVAVDAPPST